MWRNYYVKDSFEIKLKQLRGEAVLRVCSSAVDKGGRARFPQKVAQLGLNKRACFIY